jgi:predicted dehydrogenase/threonine dehydrogenase-like Zn-dependent dehydrogenase
VKQLILSTNSGVATVAELPVPALQPGTVLVTNRCSLVSAGTERTLVDFSEKSLLAKAQARPDLVRQVWDKMQRDGILTTIDTVRARLDSPLALGYSSAGVVSELGQGVTEFKVGDPVACAGFGYAVHAEVVVVPKKLVTRIPNGVAFTDAAFTTVGAIALQGIRQASPHLGENVAVIGLGLLGQLTVQMLKANGCRVFGVDLDGQRIALALELGADMAVRRDQALTAGQQFSDHKGFDSILITADTKGNDPLLLAGELARDKGVVVVVGAVGMKVPRGIYYNKELDLRLSRSYGPGRYDPQYEEQGIDYPYSYVRWTENRNMQAFLNLVAGGQVKVQKLITHCFPIEEAQNAYDLITGKTKERFLGVLITYDKQPDERRRLDLPVTSTAMADGAVRIGMIGAGAFANSVLIPAMRQTKGLRLRGLCTSTGASSAHSGRRFGFQYACTNPDHILEDSETDVVVIATPHHLHAGYIIAALNRGKHVFCEKPLCLTAAELQAITDAYQAAGNRHLMIGFNRRFAPLAVKLKDFITSIREPLLLHYRVNSGYVPTEHWIQNPQEGGGRIIGEVCHFVDFLNFLTSQQPVSLYTRVLPNHGRYADDNLVMVLTFPDGTVGTISYAANGDKALGKERVEVFGGGQTAILEDFRHLHLIRGGKHSHLRLRWRQDKGHEAEWAALVQALKTGQSTPIAFADIISTTQVTLRAAESVRQGNQVISLL